MALANMPVALRAGGGGSSGLGAPGVDAGELNVRPQNIHLGENPTSSDKYCSFHLYYPWTCHPAP